MAASSASSPDRATADVRTMARNASRAWAWVWVRGFVGCFVDFFGFGRKSQRPCPVTGRTKLQPMSGQAGNPTARWAPKRGGGVRLARTLGKGVVRARPRRGFPREDSKLFAHFMPDTRFSECTELRLMNKTPWLPQGPPRAGATAALARPRRGFPREAFLEEGFQTIRIVPMPVYILQTIRTL